MHRWLQTYSWWVARSCGPQSVQKDVRSVIPRTSTGKYTKSIRGGKGTTSMEMNTFRWRRRRRAVAETLPKKPDRPHTPELRYPNVNAGSGGLLSQSSMRAEDGTGSTRMQLNRRKEWYDAWGNREMGGKVMPERSGTVVHGNWPISNSSTLAPVPLPLP
jgi:hypothetical protein